MFLASFLGLLLLPSCRLVNGLLWILTVWLSFFLSSEFHTNAGTAMRLYASDVSVSVCICVVISHVLVPCRRKRF